MVQAFLSQVNTAEIGNFSKEKIPDFVLSKTKLR